jgi:hypothetical protein
MFMEREREREHNKTYQTLFEKWERKEVGNGNVMM